MKIKDMKEENFRKTKAIRPKTEKELINYIKEFSSRTHDYGTCVYAMSFAATAAFNYVAHKLGVTGFQARCADMDILRQTRNLEWGAILDYENLLYPQFKYKFKSYEQLLMENREELSKRAKKLLEKYPDAYSNVVAHWKKLTEVNHE